MPQNNFCLRVAIPFCLYFCVTLLSVCYVEASTQEEGSYTTEQAKAICTTLVERLAPLRKVQMQCLTELKGFEKLSEEEKRKTVHKIAHKIKELSNGNVSVEDPKELFQRDRDHILKWYLYRCEVLSEKKYICELTKTQDERTAYERFAKILQEAISDRDSEVKVGIASPLAWTYSITKENNALPNVEYHNLNQGMMGINNRGSWMMGEIAQKPNKPYQTLACDRHSPGYWDASRIVVAIDSYRDNRSGTFLHEIASHTPSSTNRFAYWALGFLVLSPRDAELQKKIEDQFQLLAMDLGEIPSCSFAFEDNGRFDFDKAFPKGLYNQTKISWLDVQSLKYCLKVQEYKASLTPDELKDFESLENNVRNWWIRYAYAPKNLHHPAHSLAGPIELSIKNPKHVLFFLEYFPFHVVTEKLMDIYRKDATIQADLKLLLKNNDFMTEEQHRLAKILIAKKQ